MKLKQIIGIAGPARCGKDTAANYIISQTSGSKKASFADPIKEMILGGLGLRTDQVYGDAKDELDTRYGCTPRHMMQTLGTEWGRQMVNGEIWVKAMETRAIPGMIIPDVRFENEAKFIRQRGILIHIAGRGRTITTDHVSENGVIMQAGDYVIDNDGSPADFEKQIERFLSCLSN